MLNIRPATRADATTIASLVRELAEYEKLEHEAQGDSLAISCARSKRRIP